MSACLFDTFCTLLVNGEVFHVICTVSTACKNSPISLNFGANTQNCLSFIKHLKNPEILGQVCDDEVKDQSFSVSISKSDDKVAGLASKIKKI